jgi:hypothetical protein
MLLARVQATVTATTPRYFLYFQIPTVILCIPRTPSIKRTHNGEVPESTLTARFNNVLRIQNYAKDFDEKRCAGVKF